MLLMPMLLCDDDDDVSVVPWTSWLAKGFRRVTDDDDDDDDDEKKERRHEEEEEMKHHVIGLSKNKKKRKKESIIVRFSTSMCARQSHGVSQPSGDNNGNTAGQKPSTSTRHLLLGNRNYLRQVARKG
jgi:hypothetical protein